MKDEEKEKVIINNTTHFCKTIEKYMNAFLSVCAAIPHDDSYRKINIKNNALNLALDITYYGERGYISFLEFKYFVTCSKAGTFNTLTRTRSTDFYEIHWYNVCNFLIAYAKCTGRFFSFPAIEVLCSKEQLPDDLKNFFVEYLDKSPSLIEFKEGEHYEIKMHDKPDDKSSKNDSNSEVIQQKPRPVNRYNW